MSTTIIRVENHPINVPEDGYVSLTDIARASKNPRALQDWITNKRTIQYLGYWEITNNKYFKQAEFHSFKNGITKSRLSVSDWVAETNAIGIYVRQGKYGGTYAHMDIAIEFGLYISIPFRFALINEYKALKSDSLKKDDADWQLRRMLTKDQYMVHTDAVMKYRLPQVPQMERGIVYGIEGDILNLSVFHFTAKQWTVHNLHLANKKKNVRDYASTNELIVLCSIQSHNASMLKDGLCYATRKAKLIDIANTELTLLNDKHPERSLRRNEAGEFQVYLKGPDNPLGMFPCQKKIA